MQRVEQIEFYSGNKLKKGFVAFLGNFITDYDRRFGDGGAILEVNLSKNKTTSEVKLAEYSFVPTYIIKEDGTGNKVQNVVPVSEIETENIRSEMSARERERCLLSGRDTRSMMLGFGNMEARYPISDDIVNDVAETIVLSGGPVNYDKFNKENKALDNFFLVQNLEEGETEEDTLTTLANTNTTTTNTKTYTKINNTQTSTTKASNNYTENDIEDFEKKFR